MVFLANYLGKYTTKDTTSKSRNAKDHKTTNIIKVVLLNITQKRT